MRSALQILIVEDERLIGAELRRRLQRMGYAVVGLVASGEEAVAQAQRLRPAVVLMDIRLRGLMDGVEAAQHIRARCHIPVVFMSAYTTVETLEHLWRMGLEGYLSKPFFESQLRLAIERAVETHHQRTRPEHPGP